MSTLFAETLRKLRAGKGFSQKEMADRLEEEGWLYRRMDDGRRWFKYGETIELSEDWMGDWVTEYDGFRVLTPEGIIRQKEELGREKDFRDIELLKEYLKQ